MRYNVVDLSCGRSHFTTGTMPAEWLTYQLLGSQSFPRSRIVQTVPCFRFSALASVFWLMLIAPSLTSQRAAAGLFARPIWFCGCKFVFHHFGRRVAKRAQLAAPALYIF